ncbi:MAG: hypothetical protein KGJ90_05035 [Patescibacteria group bacterium]|nr:hypothetical protein [Patescibacteria group bacterium]
MAKNQPTEHELTMKLSAAISKASTAARGLMFYQQNLAYSTISDTLELVGKMLKAKSATSSMDSLIWGDKK